MNEETTVEPEQGDEQEDRAPSPLRRRSPTKMTRVMLSLSGWKWGTLTELCPDIGYEVREGAPEPEAISFFTVDRTEAYVFVVHDKQRLIKAMSGGVIVPKIELPADVKT